MDDACLVGSLQSSTGLLDIGKGLFDRQTAFACNDLVQRQALDKLHDQKMHAILNTMVEGTDDVWMLEALGQSCLTAKALDIAGIGDILLAEHLDGNDFVGIHVPAQVDSGESP